MDELKLVIAFLYGAAFAAYSAFFFVQKERWHRWGVRLLGTGCLFHSGFLAAWMIVYRQIPARNLHETLVLAAWTISLAYLLLRYRYGIKILGGIASGLALLVMTGAVLVPDAPVETAGMYRHYWFALHVFLVFAGEAALTLAAGAGALYLIQERGIKAKQTGFFFRRLPSLELLDSTGHGCVVAGFSLYTLGLIIGFVYARVIWGRFWGWDPKEVWSVIAWAVFAGLLHERLAVGWRGRKAAWTAIIGWCVLVFTFVGVNFFLQGHHGRFTGW